ncbi:LLM class flavin-dependent oxidoreductase [Streptomyces sp. NPDC020800]|uniref:LLM class flavin-dependent oxidoreductase n=1 Tax=Streptomyces sp. NPDC020800 TaxID=3365092 RepID=UPI0037A4756A
MTRLKIGYLLPTRDQSVRGQHDQGRLIAQTRRAEQPRLDSVWSSARPVTRPRADPLPLLAAAAQATERVALGTAVLLSALRHPILLAHQLATFAPLSGGRLIAGMGGGSSNPSAQAQCAAVGVGFERRVGRMEESIDAMRQLLLGEAVSYQGEHFSFEDVRIAPLPSRPGGPSIWLAAHGPPALRRAARLADGWLPCPPAATTYAQEHEVIEAAIEQAATPCSVTPALDATLCPDENPGNAHRRLQTSMERYYNAPLEFIASVQAVFAGAARQAADWLTGYVVAGARHLVIRPAADDRDTGLGEFADQVLPLLRAENHR